MSILTIALLIACGFVLLVIEVLLIPGFSIPGLIGIGCVVYGVYRAWEAFGATGAMISLFVSMVGAFLIIRFAIRSRTVKMIGLDYNEQGATAGDDYTHLAGMEGVALTTLRPAGIAVFDGKRYDVVTDAEYIEKETPVRVKTVEGVRIVVTPIERN